ncbi:hypothetical protein F3Y22_tig00111210pilonHSYRG00023 [Hibiscus syriacus]|uniref:RNase H type-1 domain-containing protein n=1 Tax=Hibiscus syriacus TaxID=106335 RepID=A0A6A2YVI0_HIBSY|nr:hypothetical protein F3Y22_tig00111210pilonHSYRG00023 [Hibiscus syriacus]
MDREKTCTTGIMIRESRLTRWLPPPVGWMKVNTDGACHTEDGLAACGGVIRNDIGAWQVGFSRFLGICSVFEGICSVFESELWGMYMGLICSWELGTRQVILESDSLEAVMAVQRIGSGIARVTMLQYIEELLKRDWVVRVQHVPRQVNRAADCMASIEGRNQLECVKFIVPPDAVLGALHNDAAYD